MRAKNWAGSKSIEDDAVAGNITAVQYTDRQEALGYDYLKEHAVIAAAAVKNGNWNAGSDVYSSAFVKGGVWETLEKFMIEDKKVVIGNKSHYQLVMENYYILRGPKK